MFIGAVGSWYWQGKLRHNLRFLEFSNIKSCVIALTPLKYYDIKNVLILGQVFSQNLLPRLRNVQHKTAEGSPSDDDSYLGYSVATGEFDGDSSSPDVAVGMPRGSGLEGKVRNKNMLTIHDIISYFDILVLIMIHSELIIGSFRLYFTTLT